MIKNQVAFKLFLYSLFAQFLVFSQTQDISFREVSPPGGFIRHAILSIAEDELGYIWMGTAEGVIRYNSEHTDWFVFESSEYENSPNARVSSVFVDDNNQTWATTNLGVFLFNREKQKFDRIHYTYENGADQSGSVLSILQSIDNKMLVIENEYFGILDYKKNKLNRIGKNDIKKPSALYIDDSNRVWIGTRRGDIFRYKANTNSIEKIFSVDANVTCIYAQGNSIYVGTEDNGAKIFNLIGGFLKQVSLESTLYISNSLRIRVIKKDSCGRLWYGTDSGLYMDDGKGLVWINPENYEGIPHNSIFQIYEDSKGSLWIGTWSGGLALMHPSDNNFETFRHSTTQSSISNNVVSSFIQLNENELLIGTEVGGLNVFNLSTKTFSSVPLDKEGLAINIKSLCKDKYGGIWAGTFRKGLWYRPPGASEFQVFNNGIEDGKHISARSVYALCPLDSGVWIGTYYGGINFYSFETKSISHFSSKDENNSSIRALNVQSILPDADSNLWVGTLNSFLYRIHLPTGEITKIANNAFKNLSIYCLLKHSSGNIWIGTKNEGVQIYNPETNKIKRFNDAGILKYKSVYGIIEDSKKNIWITSNNGLIVYNPDDQSVRQFDYSDGIQSNIFNPQAVFSDLNGLLYFGGSYGFTRINPNKIKNNIKEPFTIINSLNTKNNKLVYPSYSGDYEFKTVNLSPNQTTFRINFSADNYLIPEKNNYKYRLINYYDDWISAGNDGSVLFTSLNAGEYIFEVKAANNDGIWNDTPTQMKITIAEYWYKTPWAYLIYIIFFAIILFFISRFYLDRIKLKRAFLFEKSQRENEEEVNEMKLKFFTNVSHEFRTPLTLISWPLKQLINSKNINSRERANVEIAQRNTNRLLELINQITDLRKIERSKNKLNITKIDVVQLINNIRQDFLGEVESKQIDFILESNFSKLEIEGDQQKLDTIIYNLLSNAFKYVVRKGEIKIVIDNKLSNQIHAFNNQLSYGEIFTENFVKIVIEDNGSGIDSEDLFKIFNRFEQGKQKKDNDASKVKGSGIGLEICKDFTILHHGKITVQSTLGKGCRFTLLLPIKQKAQKILFESHQIVKNLGDNDSLLVPLKKEISPEEHTHILVIEDNPDFSTFICNYLSDYYQVEHANNGKEGLIILKERNIDLIVSDVMMPEMDGFELCTTVKSQIETSHIPIILLTALSSSENLIIGLDKGADAFITKPFEKKVLLKQVENLLEQRRRIKKNFTKHFISRKPLEVGGLDNFFLNRVRKVIESNLSEEAFSIEKLANELMISRSNLHRKIKSLSGLSTSEFVNLIRLKYAVKLIKEENYRFNEVAFRVGFSSQSYFTRCFKKAYNVTPKEYFNNQKD